MEEVSIIGIDDGLFRRQQQALRADGGVVSARTAREKVLGFLAERAALLLAIGGLRERALARVFELSAIWATRFV